MDKKRHEHGKRSVLDQKCDFRLIERLGGICDSNRREGNVWKGFVDRIDGDWGK